MSWINPWINTVNQSIQSGQWNQQQHMGHIGGGYGTIGQLGQYNPPDSHTLEWMADMIIAKVTASQVELDLEAIRKVVREELEAHDKAKNVPRG